VAKLPTVVRAGESRMPLITGMSRLVASTLPSCLRVLRVVLRVLRKPIRVPIRVRFVSFVDLSPVAT
jgi:hypothetical protein